MLLLCPFLKPKSRNRSQKNTYAKKCQIDYVATEDIPEDIHAVSGGSIMDGDLTVLN